MVETLEATREHLTGQLGDPVKIVVWEHNSHLGGARATEMAARGELNVGQLVRERHAGDCRNLGFTTNFGTVTAADDWGERRSANGSPGVARQRRLELARQPRGHVGELLPRRLSQRDEDRPHGPRIEPGAFGHPPDELLDGHILDQSRAAYSTSGRKSCGNSASKAVSAKGGSARPRAWKTARRCPSAVDRSTNSRAATRQRNSCTPKWTTRLGIPTAGSARATSSGGPRPDPGITVPTASPVSLESPAPHQFGRARTVPAR